MCGVKLGNKGNIGKDKEDNWIVQANLDIDPWTSGVLFHQPLTYCSNKEMEDEKANKTQPISPVSLGITKLKQLGRMKLGNEGNIQEETSESLRQEIKRLIGWKKKKEETSETLISNGLREWKHDPGEIRQISILYSKIPMIAKEKPLKILSNLQSICLTLLFYLISKFAKDRKKEFKGTRKEEEQEELLLQKTNCGENMDMQKSFINSQNTAKMISTEKV